MRMLILLQERLNLYLNFAVRAAVMFFYAHPKLKKPIITLLSYSPRIKARIKKNIFTPSFPLRAGTLPLANKCPLAATPKGKRQMFVDVSALSQQDAKTGIQRVVRSILKELLSHPPQDRQICPVYAMPYIDSYLYANKFTQDFLHQGTEETSLDYPIDYRAGDLFLGLDFYPAAVQIQHAFLKTMSFHGVTICFVLYDLLPVLHPEYFPQATVKEYLPWLHALSEFDNVICISEAVAHEYDEWLNQNRPKECHRPRISWFHLGSDISNSMPTMGLPKDAADLLEKIRQRPTFLMVSTIEPRKGYAQALAAFELLWSQGQDINLVIVGREGWNVSELTAKIARHPEKNKRLFWLKGISDEYLEKVYDAASAVLMASEGEGFGLAVVEGAKHRKPLILRDIPVFREVAGDHAYYFRGLAPRDLATAIETWLTLYAVQQIPSSKGIKVLTWQESAKALLKIIM